MRARYARCLPPPATRCCPPPTGAQLDNALEQLDFMVSLDPYINETTRHADVILPPTSPLEHDHYDLSFHLLAMRNTTRYNPPVFARAEGALHDWEIFSELGKRVAAGLGQEAQTAVPPHQIIDMGLQAGPWRDRGLSLEELQETPLGHRPGAAAVTAAGQAAHARQTDSLRHPGADGRPGQAARGIRRRCGATAAPDWPAPRALQ